MKKLYYHRHITHHRLTEFNSYIRQRVEDAKGMTELEVLAEDANAIAAEWNTDEFPLVAVFYTCDAEIEIEPDVGQCDDDDDDGDVLARLPVPA